GHFVHRYYDHPPAHPGPILHSPTSLLFSLPATQLECAPRHGSVLGCHPSTTHSRTLRSSTSLAVNFDPALLHRHPRRHQQARFGIRRNPVRAPSLCHRRPRRLCAEGIQDPLIHQQIVYSKVPRYPE
ncbi:hypothetical protein B0H15DRAFT_1022963, partial [Mycena belliarum]